MVEPTVIGLDLSLTQPAAVVLPSSWQPGEWDIASAVLGPAKAARGAQRLVEIEAALEAFLRRQQAFGFWAHTPIHVFIEEYAFTSEHSRLAALGELGGVVKRWFWQMWRIEPEMVPPAAARKTLLGTVTRKMLAGAKAKDYANAQLAKMGAKFNTMDEGDALIVANHGRMLLGLSHVGVE